MSGHLSSLDLAVAWFNRFALQYAILGNTFTGVLAASFVVMTLFSTGRVFKRARFSWLAVATVAQVAASILNSIDARRLGLNENIPDSLFTSQVAMLFAVPLFADFALLARIKELTRQKNVPAFKDKRLIGALILPIFFKLPRIVLVTDFLTMADSCVALTKTSPLASVLMCMPAQKFALFQWAATLIDQSVSMIILSACMYHLGWGWGDKRAVSKGFLGKLSMFFSTLGAIMFLPVAVLVALLALHASGQKTHIEGYLMALQPNISVLGVVFAALYPLVRADRRLQLARVRMQVSQTEARRLSMMEFEAADPFAGKGALPAKTLLDAPHLRPSGMPTLKRHSSHSGYLNSTTYSHFSMPSHGPGGMGSPQSPQDTYTIMNVKVMRPARDLNVPNWTITTRQRSPHSESEDGMDEKVAPDAHVGTGATATPTLGSGGVGVGGYAPHSSGHTTPPRGVSRSTFGGPPMGGGSPYLQATPMSQNNSQISLGSPGYRS